MTRVREAAQPPAGISTAVIGFLDSGIDPMNPALVGGINSSYTSVDASRSDLSVPDKTGHGTNVAHIAVGQSIQGKPAGVAPFTPWLSLRLLNDNPGTGNDAQPFRSDADFAAAFQWMVDRGGKILNVSTSAWFDGPGGGPRYADFAGFIAKDRLVVVETGDGQGQSQPSALARLPFAGSDPAGLSKGWLVAGAVDSTGTALASYSRPCGDARNNCLMAPGDVVITGVDANNQLTYQRVASTDYAAAQVSGAASRVWNAFPYFSQDLVRQTLLAAATDIGDPGVDAVYGWGLMNVQKAVEGPSRFDWGDVQVVLGYNSSSYWDNPISGAGGIDIDGNGNSTLYLTGNNTYAGKTVVHNGASVRFSGSMASPVEIRDNANVMASSGVWKGDVDIGAGTTLMVTAPNPGTAPPLQLQGTIHNDGSLMIDAKAQVAFNGDYVQGPGATLNAYLGPDPLHFAGAAQLDGTFFVSGVLSTYVPTSRKVILTADEGVTGNFSQVLNSAALTLQATLGSDANQVWLDITRLDVLSVTQAIGAPAPMMASAQRVEDAFGQIDQGLAQGASINGDLLDAAGAIQQADSPQELARTLSSLSGELHDADLTFAMQALESGRQAVESRFDHIQSGGTRGAWSDSIRRKQSWSSFDVDSDGWVMGRDVRLPNGASVGASLASSDSHALHSERSDREYNRQFDGHVYTAMQAGDSGYLLGLASFGRMQRDVQREIDLGNDSYRVGTNYAQSYAAMSLQGGRRFDIGSATLTPYVGAVSLQMARDSFQEDGAAGFGLSGKATSLHASQALVGARLQYGWNFGSVRFDLQGRAEWQQLLSLTGAYDATFTGMDVWSPIVGTGPVDNVGAVSLGIVARFGRSSRISLDADARHHGDQTEADAMLRYAIGF